MPAILMCAHNKRLLVSYYVKTRLEKYKIVFFDIKNKRVYDGFEDKVNTLNHFITVNNNHNTSYEVFIYRNDKNDLKIYNC